MQRKIIVILGPTASGKTALGVEIAKKYNGEIISADSRQIYRRLDLGTGKDLEEYGEIKYHLIDICDPGEKFTLFEWLPLARKTIDDIFSRGKLPIVVGGTNLYIQALVEGFELEQDKSKKIKVKRGKFTRKFLDKQSPAELVGILKKLNPQALEKIDQKNSRRLVRAIEIAQEGSDPTKTKPDFDALQIAIDLPREKLYERIDQRVEIRFSQGMLEEVASLLANNVNPEWLVSLGLEYRIIGNFLIQNSKLKTQNINGKLKINDFFENYYLKIQNSRPFEQMKQELKWKSHQYARRQLTWLRNLSKPNWVKGKSEAFKQVDRFLKQS